MESMLKFRIENAFLQEMVNCLLKDDSDGLENLKAGLVGFYKGIGDDPLEAEQVTDNMAEIAHYFAFEEKP